MLHVRIPVLVAVCLNQQCSQNSAHRCRKAALDARSAVWGCPEQPWQLLPASGTDGYVIEAKSPPPVSKIAGRSPA